MRERRYTLPLKPGPHPEYGRRAFARFKRRLHTWNQGKFSWFVAEELGARLGRFHMHVLLGGVREGIHARELKRVYDGGLSDFREFDPARGGTSYLSGYAAKKLAGYEVGGPWWSSGGRTKKWAL